MIDEIIQIQNEIEEAKILLDEKIMSLKGYKTHYGFSIIPNKCIRKSLRKGYEVNIKLYRRYKGNSLYTNCSDISKIADTIEKYLQKRFPDLYQEIVMQGK